MHRSLRFARVFGPGLGLVCLLAACASNRDSQADRAQLDTHRDALAEMPFALPEEGTAFSVSGRDGEPLGVLLMGIDQRVRAWNNLKLKGRQAQERQAQRAMERELRELTRPRFDELVHTLQQGPTRNRSIAAAGLGFSGDPAAVGPLVAALGDREEDVIENALFALGYMAHPDTPLGPVLDLLERAPGERTRNNAGYATQRLIQSGARHPRALEVLRGGLVDPEPGVRSASAISLSLLGDGESVTALGDLLYDPVPFVALAGANSLARVGREHPQSRARAARLLVEAYTRATPTRRVALQRELVLLSGMNYGDDVEAWRRWAARVQ